ncbi:hypothetical protein HZB01_01280 [Candidatus Woesearchaeota archaeon]|nr:hypothetical protein [Candidatus Woesearchaeota archaeon]
MTTVAELQAKQGKVDIVVEIVDKGDVRQFDKFGKAGKVCNATAKDSTGEIKLTLWNEQVDQVNVGNTVKITNGYVSEYQGEKQLSTGKFGKLEVVDKEQPKTELKTNAEFPEEELPVEDEEFLESEEEDVVDGE